MASAFLCTQICYIIFLLIGPGPGGLSLSFVLRLRVAYGMLYPFGGCVIVSPEGGTAFVFVFFSPRI